MKSCSILMKIFVALECITHSSGTSNDLDSEYTTHNPHPQWCPGAVCSSSQFCRTCQRRFLFIITQGRAGSTTMKNMLNLLPGIRISGEVGDTLNMMQTLWNYIHDRNSKRNEQDKMFESANGHNEYLAGSLSCPAQQLIEVLNPPLSINSVDDSLTILGFKEIHLDSANQIEFLIKHFPCSRIIFNVRTKVEDTIKSQEVAFKDAASSVSLLKSAHLYEDYYWFYKSLHPQRVYWMEFEEWVKGNGHHFTKLANWLGFRNCVYPFNLHEHRLGSYKLDDRHIELPDDCRYVGSTTE